MKEEYDVMVLGGGIAGMTAAIYAARYNLKAVVIGQSFGGAGNLAGHVENWPGFVGSGAELMSKVLEQAKGFGAKFIEGEITTINKNKNEFFVEIDGKKIQSKTVILALGMQHRKLGVKGEKEFVGKGVSYCATCDGMFFKNKNVLVVGGSDSAAKAALYLSEIAKKVYVSYRKGEMRCEPISLEKIKGKKNIEISYFTNPVEILGDKKVTGIVLKREEVSGCSEKYGKCENFKLDVDGIFIEIGAAPVIEVVQPLGIKLNEGGFIIVDRNCKTNVEGVYAAGDNTDSSFKQLITASSEGAMAAKSAHEFLKFSK